MYKQFATVNKTTDEIPNNDIIHKVNVVFPPDQRSEELLKNVSFYKSLVHDFRIQTDDTVSSVYDMFTSMFPNGSEIQHITVRYTNLPSRSSIGLEFLPDMVESVHIISSIILEEDIDRIKLLINSKNISVRLTGMIKNSIVQEPFMKIGKDFILFSKKLIIEDKGNTILDENDALQYILDRKKYEQ